MPRRILSTLVALSCAVLLSCTAPQQRGDTQQKQAIAREPASFEEARVLARRDESSPDSLQWRRSSNQRLSQALSVTDPCMQGIAFMDIPTVTAVMRLSLQGRATKVFVREDSNYARCFGEHLRQLDMGSAPWDGYWFEVLMQGPAESAQAPSRVISFAGESCIPGGEATPTGHSLKVSKITPASGSKVTEADKLSITLSYSVPSPVNEQYKVMVLFDTTTPGRATGPAPVDFPYPASCGPTGSITGSMPANYFLNMPNLTDPVQIHIVLMGASGSRVLAQTGGLAFSKQ